MALDISEIKAQNSLPHVIARYVSDIRERGGKYWCLCPFHKDTRPNNFNVYRASDGWRYRCFACGEHGDVIDFVATINNISTKDALNMLAGESLPEAGSHVPKDIPPDETVLWIPIIPVPDYAPDYIPEYTYNPARGKTVNYQYGLTRKDPYYDADGNLICYVVRLVYEDGHKVCPTITYCEGPEGQKCWTAKRMPAPYPLQGLDALAKYPTKHVILTSGEKCKAAIDAFVPGMFVVVSWLGGDDAVKNADLTPLNGRKVTYWPDADNTGRKAMNYAFKAIEKDGTG